MTWRGSVLRELGLGPLWLLRQGSLEEERAARPAQSAPAPASQTHQTHQTHLSQAQIPPTAAQTVAPHLPSQNEAPQMPAPMSDAALPARPVNPPTLPPREVQPQRPREREERQKAPAAAASPRRNSADEASLSSSSVDVRGLDWSALQAKVTDCQACGLCKKRKQAVFGVGDRQADWLFVGEGPGADEDERGEPFVGQAGKLLDAMLAAIHLKRGDDVYIANAVKCRPPGNRTPEVAETAACFPYLARQIELIQPKLIVALGRPAAQTLLQTEIKIGAARGKLFDYRGIPVIVTYHPAYLLRNLPEKAKAWEDLCFARQTMAGL